MSCLLNLQEIFYGISSYSGVLLFFIVLFLVAIIFPCFDYRIGLRKKYIEVVAKILDYANRKPEEEEEVSPDVSLSTEKETSSQSQSLMTPKLSFENPDPSRMLNNADDGLCETLLPYMTAGVSSIVSDSVMPFFLPEKLPVWNFLCRNKSNSYEITSIPSNIIWVLGICVRYVFMLPFRLVIFIVGLFLLTCCTTVVGFLGTGHTKRYLNDHLSRLCFNFIGGCFALVATFHDRENAPKRGIAVANHTSPLDSLILATDVCYDLIGQSHGGILGYMMHALSRSSTHIWFERQEARDRATVIRKIEEHVANPELPPVLIFPEGVCVNNTSVMQFRKGTFALRTEFYPIAIKFDPLFGDPFWCQETIFGWIISMMTSWAIVCDVYYLPPMRIMPGETPTEFAKRVKSAIAVKGGLSDITYDGFLKFKINDELKKLQQSAFSSYLLSKEAKRRSSCMIEQTDECHSKEDLINARTNPDCRHRVLSTSDKSTDTSDLNDIPSTSTLQL